MLIPTCDPAVKIPNKRQPPHSFLSGLLRTDFVQVRQHHQDLKFFSAMTKQATATMFSKDAT